MPSWSRAHCTYCRNRSEPFNKWFRRHSRHSARAHQKGNVEQRLKASCSLKNGSRATGKTQTTSNSLSSAVTLVICCYILRNQSCPLCDEKCGRITCSLTSCFSKVTGTTLFSFLSCFDTVHGQLSYCCNPTTHKKAIALKLPTFFPTLLGDAKMLYVTMTQKETGMASPLLNLQNKYISNK